MPCLRTTTAGKRVAWRGSVEKMRHARSADLTPIQAHNEAAGVVDTKSRLTRGTVPGRGEHSAPAGFPVRTALHVLLG